MLIPTNVWPANDVLDDPCPLSLSDIDALTMLALSALSSTSYKSSARPLTKPTQP